ncbi:cob(I)yrinic acid a,c-diamide adenosyltransferase [bacterium]|nr:cob(I)yrinic acid a,c-diamide adenosyltransferase [bacterium]
MQEKESQNSKRKVPWFTGKGDDGSTQLLGGIRVPKYSIQPDTYGTVDEATSVLGLARSLSRQRDVKNTILIIQRHLYKMMTELASTHENREKYQFISLEHVQWLGEMTEQFGEKIEMPQELVIPGDTPGGGGLDLARSVIRRSERMVLRAGVEGFVCNSSIAIYLNRLSSLCYVMARYEDITSGSGKVTLAKDVSTIYDK